MNKPKKKVAAKKEPKKKVAFAWQKKGPLLMLGKRGRAVKQKTKGF